MSETSQRPQYQYMQVYWFNNTIDDGGITSLPPVSQTVGNCTGNNSYACYDRIIENAILLNDVDPNRVYLMGYSAGGDVQSHTRHARQICCSEHVHGHPNGVSVMNLHVPTLLQVGECDTAYNRHKIAVQYNQSLQKRREACGGDGYISECRVRGVRARSARIFIV